MAIVQKFYRCETCGNIVGLIHEGGGQLVCCGQPMKELIPGAVDAATEKHVPVCTLDGNKLSVQVGSVEHPMLEDHWIQWICVTDGKQTQRIKLNPGDAPKAEFILADPSKPFVVFEYCNLHGLWKAEK